MNSKKLSGCQYKNKLKEKAEQLTNVLNRTQKVDAYFKLIKENEEQQVSISSLPQPNLTNDSNIINSPKKQILENQNLESVPFTSSAIHCHSLPPPR